MQETLENDEYDLMSKFEMKKLTEFSSPEPALQQGMMRVRATSLRFLMAFPIQENQTPWRTCRALCQSLGNPSI